ncbi:response regulator [Paragemmobacter straminiformis]|uniref:Response regulator n=1 Tax=Paragemmobacter straminiformis TaxID=2045119 RepID=A0A842I7Q6_9RHOB|nr:response regulator [Gemmobacter straminiformis]MBC2835669.1 response regulator [Gemmobacter straminiformis]
MQSPAKLLHVEDDEDILMIARMVLVDLGGYDLMQCASGAEAVEKAADFGPDMMILDYMMPGMNGLATLRALRGLPGLADVPAAFMTAKVLDVPPDELKSLGVVGVIPKPFDPVSLPAQVNKLWLAAKGQGA